MRIQVLYKCVCVLNVNKTCFILVMCVRIIYMYLSTYVVISMYLSTYGNCIHLFYCQKTIKLLSSIQYTPSHVTNLFSPLPQGCLEDITHLAIRLYIVVSNVLNC